MHDRLSSSYAVKTRDPEAQCKSVGVELEVCLKPKPYTLKPSQCWGFGFRASFKIMPTHGLPVYFPRLKPDEKVGLEVAVSGFVVEGFGFGGVGGLESSVSGFRDSSGLRGSGPCRTRDHVLSVCRFGVVGFRVFMVNKLWTVEGHRWNEVKTELATGCGVCTCSTCCEQQEALIQFSV